MDDLYESQSLRRGAGRGGKGSGAGRRETARKGDRRAAVTVEGLEGEWQVGGDKGMGVRRPSKNV